MAIYNDLDGTRKSSFSVGTTATGKIQIAPSTGVTFSDGTAQLTAAVGASPVPPDANDIMVYTCDETSGNLINTGTLGTANNLVLQTGTPVLGETGVFGNCLHCLESSAVRYEAVKTGAEPAYPVTMSCWIKPTALGSDYFTLLCKSYRVGSWNSPFASLLLNITTSGYLNAGVAIGGSLTQLATSSSYILHNLMWQHIGMTYDGATLKLYVNGNLAGSQALTGAIDYYSGSGGSWAVGTHTTGGNTFKGWIDEIRIANVARPASWFRQVYLSG